MSWLDLFRRKQTDPGINYQIDSNQFPVLVYHNVRLDCHEFWEVLPKVGDPHLYRDDMFVTSVNYDCSTATVTYEQGSQVVLPTMEVVWQPPS